MTNQLFEHYLRLVRLLPQESVGRKHEITLEQAANILSCTPRNAKMTLKKMEAINWITWEPGRGRGNRSSLQCLIEPDDLLFGLAREMVRKGEIRAAASLINQFETKFPSLAERFSIWVNSMFGFHVLGEGEHQADTLRLAYDGPFLQLDPAHATLHSELHMVKHIYDTLLRYNPQTESIEPHLAYHWDANEAKTEWTFYLRKRVMFHHGRTMTADDVAYSMERIRNPVLSSPYRWLVDTIENIIVLDRHTLRITLRQQNELILSLLCNEHLAILPRDYTELTADGLAAAPVGTGPFKVLRNDDSMLVMEAFDMHFLDRPLLDRIEIWLLPAEANFEIQYQWHTPIPEAMRREWNETARTEQSVQCISFNMKKPGILRDPRFRKALDIILNREKLIADTGGSRQEAMKGLFIPAVQTNGEETSDNLSLLLAESGYRGEMLRLHTSPDFDHMEDARWLMEQCARFGIMIELVFYPFETLLQPENMAEADLILDSATDDENMEISFLNFLLAENFMVRNHLAPELESYAKGRIDVMLNTPNRQEREEIILEIERRLVEDRAFLGLYRNRVAVLSHPQLQSVQLNAQGWVDFRQLWYRKVPQKAR